MVYLWEIDASLRAQFDIDTEWGACLYCVYLWLHKERYPGLTLPPGMDQSTYFHSAIDLEQTGIPLTRFMQALLSLESHLASAFPVHAPESRLGYWAWFLINFPELTESPQYFALLAAPSVSIPVPPGSAVLPLALLVEHQRNVGLSHFDYRTPEGSWSLAQWWLTGGGLEIPMLGTVAKDWARRWRENLAVGSLCEMALACAMALWCAGQEPFALLAPTGGAQAFLHAMVSEADSVPTTRFMRTLLFLRQDIRSLFNTNSPKDILLFWWWMLQEQQGFHEHPAFVEHACKSIISPFSTEIATLPLWLYVLWHVRQDLNFIDITTQTGVEAFLQWWHLQGLTEYPFLHVLSNRLDRSQAFTAGHQRQGELPRHFAGLRQSGGVNVIGFAKGEFGIGEDARMATRACQEAGIPVCVLDVPYEIPSRRNDQRLEGLLAAEPRFAVNIFCMPIFEVLRMYFLYGEELFRDRFNIGICPWELPSWPSELAGALRLLDALWAPSTYIAAAYAPWATHPVVHVPLAVEAAKIAAYPRADYGIPDDIFVFLFICDGSSWNPRKNPLGVVNAFRRAFPDAQAEKVRLVVKTMNNQPDAPDFLALQAQQALDIGLILINETVSYEALLGLHACSDAYVSLHRAEGFGRTMAEAMLLEKPVIASSFSGNLDFCNDDTAFLVAGHTIQVESDAYIFYKHQYWFEPDTNSAAALMRQVRFQPEEAARRAKNGKAFIEHNHSPAAVGRIYTDCLRQLGLLE